MRPSIDPSRELMATDLFAEIVRDIQAPLDAWLTEQGRTVVRTCQPSPGPIGVMIRDALARRVLGTDGDRLDPRAIAALFSADRADHLHSVIEPALAAGKDVVCDRYLYSSLA